MSKKLTETGYYEELRSMSSFLLEQIQTYIENNNLTNGDIDRLKRDLNFSGLVNVNSLAIFHIDRE